MLSISPTYFYNKPSVNFKCYSGFTDVQAGDKKQRVNNYTTFFRDFKTLDFTKNYILKNFPNGTKIAEFGCSTGQKPYSLMILLEEQNKDRKYKCTGYDFPEVLKISKETPLFGLNQYTKEEEILFDVYNHSELFGKKIVTPQKAQEYRDTFFKYFSEYKPEKTITGERYKYLKKLVEENKDKTPDEIKKAKEDLFYFDLISRTTKVVKANGKAKELVDFVPGNIKDIDKILKPKENGVVIFQNALYHILSKNDLYYEIQDLKKNVDEGAKLFKKINRVLPLNGIFVLGTLPSDHIYDYECEKDSHLAYQNDRQIRVYDSSPIHKSLRENGFEPVFYEETPDNTAYVDYKDIHLPSVWKKVREA